MYQSPIEIITKQIRTQFEDNVFKAIQDYGIVVDKEELIKALQYDRGQYEKGYAAGMLAQKSEWISVEERLPSEDEYLTHHNDRLSSLKRITIAYMTDTVEYTIGCYDGYKWVNQLGNKKIENIVAWKPFETYEPPKMKGGAK